LRADKSSKNFHSLTILAIINPMDKYKILYAVGKDRTGIVEEVSSFLYDNGANIEDSRMATLGGRFSIMCLFSCSDDKLTTIESKLADMAKKGLETSLHDADDPATVKTAASLPLSLEVISMDHPGIVQHLVKILRDHEVNITSMDTTVKSMPHSGAPLFDLSLTSDVPTGTTIGELKEKLNDLAYEQNLDLNFRN